MKRPMLIGLLILLLTACGDAKKDTSAEKQRAQKKKEAAAKKKKVKEEDIVLTKENAATTLSEYAQKHPENTVVLHTSMGDMKIELYEDTPLHRANFIRLARQDYFDSTLFFRVVKDFMIQGGDTDDRAHRKKKKAAGHYFIPAEMHPHHIHKRGALAAARYYEDNPEKESAAFEFYIIQGLKYNQPMLEQFAKENDMTFTPLQSETYKSVGGAPHLDGEHTVFGEVVEGLEVMDKIASVEVGQGDWPLEDVHVLDVEVLEKEQ